MGGIRRRKLIALLTGTALAVRPAVIGGLIRSNRGPNELSPDDFEFNLLGRLRSRGLL